MATSPNTQASYHTRSVSLPSRSHPVVAQIDEDLSRLRSSESASTSYPSISQKLGCLQNLYHHLGELLLLPLNQQSGQTKRVDVVLGQSLRLLDLCSTARDALSQTKDCVQDIHSVLRRRFSGELSIANDIAAYINTRKKVKKAIKNCLKEVKSSDSNEGGDAIVGLLRDIEAVTYNVFKSLFSHITGSKKSNWLVKLINQGGDKQEVASTSGFQNLDEALNSLVPHVKKAGFNMTHAEYLTSDIMTLESEIQDLDEALDSLFRHLVKTRAILLNVLSN